MQFEYIDTERLQLRKFNPELAQYVIQNLPHEEIMQFHGFTTNEELDKEKTKFSKGYSTFNRSFLYFHLIEKVNEKVIGWCGYHTWYIDHDRAEIGYVLNSDDHKRKGYLSEAIVPIVEFGFNEMKLSRIEAMVSPKNEPSLKILRKMKFVQEGYLRAHYKVHGVMEDSLIFSLLKNEYF